MTATYIDFQDIINEPNPKKVVELRIAVGCGLYTVQSVPICYECVYQGLHDDFVVEAPPASVYRVENILSTDKTSCQKQRRQPKPKHSRCHKDPRSVPETEFDVRVIPEALESKNLKKSRYDDEKDLKMLDKISNEYHRQVCTDARYRTISDIL